MAEGIKASIVYEILLFLFWHFFIQIRQLIYLITNLKANGHQSVNKFTFLFLEQFKTFIEKSNHF